MQILHPIPVTPKWRKWMLVLAGATLAIMISALLVREPEPSYEGKSLSQWIVVHRDEVYLSYRDIPTKHKGADAIRHIGTNGLPWLVRWVHFDSPGNSFKSLVKKLPDAITPQPVSSWANDSFNGNRAMMAAMAFAALGDDARSAIPELTTVMTNSPVTNGASMRAIYALAGIGKAALPELTAQIANTNLPNRRQLIHSFGAFPSLATNAGYATSAVPLLVRYLNAPDRSIARAAFLSLGKMADYDCSQATLVVPELINYLPSNAPLDTRVMAISTLGHYGVLASNAVPNLVAAMEDSDQQVRFEATQALQKIAPWAIPNTSKLIPRNPYFLDSGPLRTRDAGL